ncbi:uncharacterized protein LOC122391675 [Amphibalanus amphitrite]|uniref:uncharacterized protein LOC122391675 n=1 Tax=Amphibalanus amphitrite TaxID=1232801 RepID=UPI001C90ECC5|nr:uncharacterized protein LOC122391675 [Amphibalanus amphitrite]
MNAPQKRVHPTPSPRSQAPNGSWWASPSDAAVSSHLQWPLGRVSIVGLNIVLSGRACWLRRLLWLLVLLVLLAWLAWQLTTPFDRLARGGTTWQFSKRKENSVRLPAITICHNNKFNRTAVEAMSVPGAGLLQWLSEDTEPFSLLDWDRYNLDQFLEAAAFDWRAMVTQCRIAKSHCLEVGAVRTLQSPMLGHCATLVTNASVQASILSPQFFIALSESGSFEEDEHDGWTLFLHQSDILFDDFVLFAGLAKPLKLYANSSITVKVDTNINVLLSNTGKCGDATAPEHQTCLEQCIAEHANLTSASCRIPWIKSSLSQPPCTSYRDFVTSGLRLPNSFDEYKMAEALKHCPCIQPCSWLEYIISTPYRIGLRETRGALGPGERSSGAGPSSRAELWFSTTVHTTEERQLYPLSQFLAEVGGSLGLMVGASLLTLAEMVDCLICVCLNAAQRRRPADCPVRN